MTVNKEKTLRSTGNSSGCMHTIYMYTYPPDPDIDIVAMPCMGTPKNVLSHDMTLSCWVYTQRANVATLSSAIDCTVCEFLKRLQVPIIIKVNCTFSFSCIFSLLSIMTINEQTALLVGCSFNFI